MAALSQIVVLRCGGTAFGVPIERVREIVMVPEVTPVPESGACVRGIINLRGRILPVLDLGQRLGLPSEKPEDGGRILVVEHDASHTLGLLVDEASEVLRVSAEVVGPPPQTIGAVVPGCLSGVARLPDRLILLLDLDRVLSEPSAPGPLAGLQEARP